jgi:hypothetical protein
MWFGCTLVLGFDSTWAEVCTKLVWLRIHALCFYYYVYSVHVAKASHLEPSLLCALSLFWIKFSFLPFQIFFTEELALLGI